MGQVILWWERRRLAYNIYILIAGTIVVLAREGTRGHLREAMLFHLLVLQLPANIWYTFGWIVELMVKLVFGDRFPRFRSVAYWAGLALSLIFVVVMDILLASAV